MALPPVYTERLCFLPHVAGRAFSDPVPTAASWVVTCVTVYYGGLLEVETILGLWTPGGEAGFFWCLLGAPALNRSSVWLGRLKLYEGERLQVDTSNVGFTTEYVDVAVTGYLLQGE